MCRKHLPLRLFPAACTLAVLLLALAACGSDEPSDETRRPTSTTEPTNALRPTVQFPLAATSAETDREALVALYKATNGPNWEYDNNWLTDAPLDKWLGVDTDDNRRVTRLQLNDNLSGEIPPELGNLANLVLLNLSSNELSGCVPSSLQGQLNVVVSDLGDLPFC